MGEIYTNVAQRQVVQHACLRLMGEDQACQEPAGGSEALPKALTPALRAGFQSLAHLLDLAHRSRDFYEAQMQRMETCAACAICFEAMDEAQQLVMLPCAHVFHRCCVTPILSKAMPRCPECRAAAGCVSPVALELRNQGCRPPAALSRHGSKLSAIAVRLQKIRAQEPTEPCRGSWEDE